MTEQLTFYIKDEGFVSIKSVEGKIAPVIVLKDSIARRYAGFRLILKDLITVRKCLLAIKPIVFDGQSSIHKQSLSFYAVITYGKCFTASDGRKTKLEEAALKYATNTQKEIHKKIMHMRHSYVAHSGLEGYEQNPVVIALNPSNHNDVVELYDNLMGLVDIDSLVEEFDALVESIQKYVAETNIKTFEKLKEIVSALKIDELGESIIYPTQDQIVNIKVGKNDKH